MIVMIMIMIMIKIIIIIHNLVWIHGQQILSVITIFIEQISIISTLHVFLYWMYIIIIKIIIIIKYFIIIIINQTPMYCWCYRIVSFKIDCLC